MILINMEVIVCVECNPINLIRIIGGTYELQD